MSKVVIFDDAWLTDVAAECDAVFDQADVGFVRQVHYTDASRQAVSALLWEANPEQFAAKYPDSGIVEAYGEEDWPGVQCIDFWVCVDHEQGRARVNVEGWNLPEMTVQLRGHGELDGAQLADLFARVLGIQSPRT